MKNILIKGAKEGNLKNLSVEIPKNKFVVLTGVSGSGKSTLAVDVLYQECQRQYLEAMGYQGIHKPGVDSIKNASPAVRITQEDCRRNPRSTVGTVTDIYTELRMIYEKLGERTCPFCGAHIRSCECREELVRKGADFEVFMYCSDCGRRMKKLTRTEFSYNTREGACPKCQGLGKILTINKDRVLRKEKSPEGGAVDFWEQKYQEYQTACLYRAFEHYKVPVLPDTPIQSYSPAQNAVFLYGTGSDEVKAYFPDIVQPKTIEAGRFEGVYTNLYRRFSEKGGSSRILEPYFEYAVCDSCEGERLKAESRNVTVSQVRLPQLSGMSLTELSDWLEGLEKTIGPEEEGHVASYLRDLKLKLARLKLVGLSYLTLDRQTMTLSGGEAQRVKLAAILGSEITGIIYIVDEPTIGLHPKDTKGVVRILKELQKLGNTVLVIEHDPDVMKEADYIVDMGPGAGRHGGKVMAVGTFQEILKDEESVTGQYLRRELAAAEEYAEPDTETKGKRAKGEKEKRRRHPPVWKSEMPVFIT